MTKNLKHTKEWPTTFNEKIDEEYLRTHCYGIVPLLDRIDTLEQKIRKLERWTNAQ